MGKKIALNNIIGSVISILAVFGDNSHTTLKADLRQDINGWFLHLAGVLIEHFLEGSALLSLKALVS